MEPMLISGFCSVKRMRIFNFSWMDTKPLQVSSQQIHVLIYLPRKHEKLS